MIITLAAVGVTGTSPGGAVADEVEEDPAEEGDVGRAERGERIAPARWRLADRSGTPKTGLPLDSGTRPRNSGSIPCAPERPAILICADEPPPVVAAQFLHEGSLGQPRPEPGE